MTDKYNCLSPTANKVPKPCALLWDESYLWGVMALEALQDERLPFDLVGADDIGKGCLADYGMLFVPGGWATNKAAALGQEGRRQIRSFVAGGGNYLGICGGAGLATAGGLELLPVTRMSSQKRLPSFSGPIGLSHGEHKVWENVGGDVFYAWWPSQFCLADDNLVVLARYGDALAEAFSADIQVGDGRKIGWDKLEKHYGMFLDPSRMKNEPAVIEGRFGHGRVILSLVHFDTPGDRNSATVLRNLWSYLASGESNPEVAAPGEKIHRDLPVLTKQGRLELETIKEAVDELIRVGTRNFLWRRRNPFLLQWRRGVRGLEYSTLALMIDKITNIFTDDGRMKRRFPNPESCFPPAIEEDLVRLRREALVFVEKSIDLLIQERFYLMHSPLSPLHCPDEAISRLRDELFGPAMSHGGYFKKIIGEVDRIFLALTGRRQ